MFVIIADSIGSMGGTRTFLERLLDLHKKQSIPTLLVLQESNVDSEIKKLVEDSGFSILAVSNRSDFLKKPYFSLLYDFYVYSKIKSKFKPSLIFCSIGTPRLFLGLFLFKVPLIYFLHTIPNPCSWKSKPLNFLSRLAGGSKRFATVSNAAKSAIVNAMRVRSSDIEVVYNSVDLPDSVQKSYTKNSLSVLTVGHVIEYKNPYVWFDVAKKIIERLPGTTFTWVGEGPLLDVMRDIVIAAGLSDSIKFDGLQTDMQHYYKEASVYFHPSQLESHGIAIIEAMSFALPVVASNVGGIPESVHESETGFLHDKDDVDGFVESIVNLLTDRALAEKLGRRGYQRVVTLFTIQQQEAKLLGLYNKLSGKE